MQEILDTKSYIGIQYVEIYRKHQEESHDTV